MICLREHNDYYKDTCIKHSEFVLTEINKRIEFYISFFNFLGNLDSGVDKITFIKEFKAFKKSFTDDKRPVNHMQLLRRLVHEPSKLKTIDDLFLLTDSVKLVVTDLGALSTCLSELLLETEGIVGFDIGTDASSNITIYESWKERFDKVAFLFTAIFDYETWFSKLKTSNDWGPYQLAKEIGNRSCPYCNRQYTFTVYEVRGRKFGRPDFDHFLPKDSFPLFALSFYNLIPSCKGCNNLKGNKKVNLNTHLSPYEVFPKHDKMRFNYLPLDYKSSVGNGENLEIQLSYSGNPEDNELKRKVEANIELFGLKEIYAGHTDIVRDIIKRRHDFNDKYLEIISKTFKNFPLNQEDVYRLSFGNYFHERDFHRRPLSKLTKDIAIELNVLHKWKR